MPFERLSGSWNMRILEPIAVCMISPADEYPTVGVPISALFTINLRPLTARVLVYESVPHMNRRSYDITSS